MTAEKARDAVILGAFFVCTWTTGYVGGVLAFARTVRIAGESWSLSPTLIRALGVGLMVIASLPWLLMVIEHLRRRPGAST